MREYTWMEYPPVELLRGFNSERSSSAHSNTQVGWLELCSANTRAQVHVFLQKKKAGINSWRKHTGLESEDIKGPAPHLIHIFSVLILFNPLANLLMLDCGKT
ncbi:hypothetical protein FXO38_01662 [Capsicum annuum]|nr:hypothetical protein FXO37_07160 [Capsicum annuum]KAF3681546.1 hypothetical protein FXO38_01662 [Capsicum annuum]